MNNIRIMKRVVPLLLLGLLGLPANSPADDQARNLVLAAIEYYRGAASIANFEMTIHRPAWERTMTMKAWTRGREESLFTIMSPAKDRGNGTLKKGRQMWTFNPKVNRVIKLPPSMMSQSWMGSDFSNNDLAKSDAIIDDYTHTLAGTETREGHTVYIVDSIPKPDAPVVWGRQRLAIREDHIMLREEYYDEEGLLVKVMTGEDITEMGGRLFPRVWTMGKAERPGEFTRIVYRELEFKESLPDKLFTLASLKRVRQ
jgi:outer membrane lipoprotein-sorting protein